MPREDENDKEFWAEVEETYQDNLESNLNMNDVELWEFAKERATRRLFLQKLVDKTKLHEKTYVRALGDNYISKFYKKKDVN